MAGSLNRDKKKALFFITLGAVISFFSYQNFKYYPDAIAKTNVDVTGSLQESDSELRRFRSHMANQQVHAKESPRTVQAIAAQPATQVVEAPMKLKLKRAPAKTSTIKKSKKKKNKKKARKKSDPSENEN